MRLSFLEVLWWIHFHRLLVDVCLQKISSFFIIICDLAGGTFPCLSSLLWRCVTFSRWSPAVCSRPPYQWRRQPSRSSGPAARRRPAQPSLPWRYRWPLQSAEEKITQTALLWSLDGNHDGPSGQPPSRYMDLTLKLLRGILCLVAWLLARGLRMAAWLPLAFSSSPSFLSTVAPWVEIPASAAMSPWVMPVNLGNSFWVSGCSTNKLHTHTHKVLQIQLSCPHKKKNDLK